MNTITTATTIIIIHTASTPPFPNPLQHPQGLIDRHERKGLQDKAGDYVDGEDTHNFRNFTIYFVYFHSRLMYGIILCGGD